MARARFWVLGFVEHLGNRESDLPSPQFNFVGDQSTVKHFRIDGEPSPDGLGYLLMQVYHVQNLSHRILINDVDLVGNDIIPTSPVGHWHLWMDVFGAEVLEQGVNTIQVVRAPGGDNFYVGNITVHWEELE
jgi:hypothetical protein